MHQTKESNKCTPGLVVIYISVHLLLIYTVTFSNVLLLLALNFMLHIQLLWMQFSMMSSENLSFIYNLDTSPPNDRITRSNMQVLIEIKNPTIIKTLKIWKACALRENAKWPIRDNYEACLIGYGWHFLRVVGLKCTCNFENRIDFRAPVLTVVNHCCSMAILDVQL